MSKNDTVLIETQNLSFFAINPLVRPMTEDMNIIFIKIDKKTNKIKDIFVEFDPFNVKPTDDLFIAFIAYNRSLPYTKKLYSYKKGDDMIFTFDKDPNQKNYLENVFVLDDKDVLFDTKCIPGGILSIAECLFSKETSITTIAIFIFLILCVSLLVL